MKRSSVFLGTTALCLAAAGIAVAKSNNGIQEAWYYTAAGFTHIKKTLAPCISKASATITCKTVTNLSVPYFTNSICTHPLRYTQL